MIRQIGPRVVPSVSTRTHGRCAGEVERLEARRLAARHRLRGELPALPVQGDEDAHPGGTALAAEQREPHGADLLLAGKPQVERLGAGRRPRRVEVPVDGQSGLAGAGPHRSDLERRLAGQTPQMQQRLEEEGVAEGEPAIVDPSRLPVRAVEQHGRVGPRETRTDGDISDAIVALAASAYTRPRAASGSTSERSTNPSAAMAAAEESRGASGMSGAWKSQNGTMSSGRSARYRSVTLRAASRNGG